MPLLLPLFPPLLPVPTIALLAANVIGDGDDCGNRCGRNGRSDNGGAFRSFSEVMFKILHYKSNHLNIKYEEWDGLVDRSKMARTPHSRRGHAVAVVFVFIVILGGGIGGGSGITATHYR